MLLIEGSSMYLPKCKKLWGILWLRRNFGQNINDSSFLTRLSVWYSMLPSLRLQKSGAFTKTTFVLILNIVNKIFQEDFGFNCWFSFAPVFQWCCSAPRGSPGVGRNTFLSSPHLCFIIVFICDLFVSRDDSLMS